MALKNLTKISNLSMIGESPKITIMDGVNERIDGSTSGVYDIDRTDTFSVSILIDASSVSSSMYLVSKRTVLTGWGIQITSSGRLNFIARDGSYSNPTCLDVYCDENTIVSGIGKQYVTVTYDGSGSKAGVSFYLNGVLLNNSSFGIAGFTSGSMITTEPISIGASAVLGRYFHGSIYETMIWEGVLTPAEVLTNYSRLWTSESPVQKDNLIMWNKMGRHATVGANILYPDDSGSSEGYLSVNMDSSNLIRRV